MLSRQLDRWATSSRGEWQLEMGFKMILKATRLEKQREGDSQRLCDKKKSRQRGKRQDQDVSSQGWKDVEDLQLGNRFHGAGWHPGESGVLEVEKNWLSTLWWGWVRWHLRLGNTVTSMRAFSMETHLVGLSSKENEDPAESTMRNGHCQEFTTKVHNLKFLCGMQTSVRVQEQACTGTLHSHKPTLEDLSCMTNIF